VINGARNTTLAFALVVVLAIISSFSFQGSRGLYETTEGRYAESAREMVETGKYLIPTLDYQPHWTKPPLAYWGIATGIILFGQSEWGVRFSNSLSYFFTIIIVIILGSLLWEYRVGLIAGLIYLSSPFPFFGVNAVSTDTLLTLWEVFAVLCFLKAYTTDGLKRKTAWIAGMWFIFGLGFLTKGPPSLLPLLPIIVWNYTRKNKVALFRGFGVPLFLLTGFSWFIIVSIKNPHLVTYFLKTEVVDRVSSAAVHNPEWYGPFTIYLPVLLGGQGAWIYFCIRSLWRSIRSGPKKVLSFIKKNEEVFFVVLWIIIPLLIFSISKSRLELYVLPLYAPIALLIARWINGYEGITWKRLILIGVVSVIILAVFRLGVSHVPNRHNMGQVYTMGQQAGSANAEYFVFEEDKLFGMQFYLNGTMQRVTLKGHESWSDAGIDDLLSSLRSENMAAEYLILSSRKKAPLVERALSGSDLDVQKTENKYWIWFRITQQEQ
jgi:4-amino-4-deoxy-L-arabinose transferase